MKKQAEYWASLLFIAVCALLAGAFALRYLLPVLLPFALAYLLALATGKTAEKLHRKTGISTPLLRVLLLVFSILFFFSLFLFLGICLAREAEELLAVFSGGERLFSGISERVRAFLFRIDRGGVLGKATDVVLSEASALALSLLSGVVGGVLAFLPQAILFLLVTLVSALYFALDLHRVQASFAELCPNLIKARLGRVLRAIRHFLLRYLRAYALLSFMIFLLLLVGFLFMRVRYAVLLAFLLTLFDLLPIFGVGFALVPWALFLLAAGNAARGFALLLLFAVIFTVRQLAEPKLVGAEMGIHPLLTLLLSYAGLRLFGFLGVILLPLSAGVLRSLWREGEEEKKNKRE